MVKLIYTGDPFSPAGDELQDIADRLVAALNEVAFIISELKNPPAAIIKTYDEVQKVDRAFEKLVFVLNESRKQLDENSILDFATANEQKFVLKEIAGI